MVQPWEGDSRGKDPLNTPAYLPVLLPNGYGGALIPPFPPQKLDLERETIELVHTEPTSVAQLPSRVPRDAARYHFFLYKHTHEGDSLESVGE